MRPRTFLPLVIALVVPVAACGGDAPLSPATSPEAAAQAMRVPAEGATSLFWFADGAEVEGSQAGVLRTADALRVRTHTNGLPHGHVMTLWWVIFNHPEHCEHGVDGLRCGEADLFDGPDGPTGVAPSCVFAGGSIVGGNGQARFNDRLTIGENRDSCIEFFVDAVPALAGQDHGLMNPEGADVHLVVRSHGPILPGQVPEQRGTFAGGCVEFLGPGAGPALARGECSDLQFAIFEVED